MLTSEWSTVEGLAWSQDGREIWFSAAAKGMGRGLFAVTLEGRLRVVAQFPSSVVLQDVAPDGRALLVSERGQAGIRGRSSVDDKERELGWLDFPWPQALSLDGKMLLLDDVGETAGPTYTVYLRDMDGSPPVRLGEGAGCALSPDGRWALTIHFGPPHRLVLIPTGPGDTLSLPRGQMETYQSGSFLPNGRRIVFVGAERGHPQRTWVQELPGGLPSAVTPEGAVGVATSPDGRWVAAVTQDFALRLFPLQGGEPRSVAKLAPDEEVSQWSADGRTLLVRRSGTRLDVFGIDAQSGQRRLWKTVEVPDPAGVRVLTFRVTRDARSYAYGYLRILGELYLAEGLK
jgi:WD40 repeat protein